MSDAREVIIPFGPGGSSTPMVIVDHKKGVESVGIGLEPRSVVPELHFIDAFYGDANSLWRIGKAFFDANRETWPQAMPWGTNDGEAKFYETLGRSILDAVTGSGGPSDLMTWLDRPSTNRLIRLLRKYRDLAFGRDE